MIDDDGDDDYQAATAAPYHSSSPTGMGARKVHDGLHEKRDTGVCFNKWLAQRRKQQNIRSNIQACKRKYCQYIGKL